MPTPHGDNVPGIEIIVAERASMSLGGSPFREELANLPVDSSPLTIRRKIGRFITLRTLELAEPARDTPHHSAVHAAAVRALLEAPGALRLR